MRKSILLGFMLAFLFCTQQCKKKECKNPQNFRLIDINSSLKPTLSYDWDAMNSPDSVRIAIEVKRQNGDFEKVTETIATKPPVMVPLSSPLPLNSTIRTTARGIQDGQNCEPAASITNEYCIGIDDIVMGLEEQNEKCKGNAQFFAIPLQQLEACKSNVDSLIFNCSLNGKNNSYVFIPRAVYCDCEEETICDCIQNNPEALTNIDNIDLIQRCCN